MEYLMTYGWALLVIFIVIAVLYFLSQSFGGETCQFDQAGLTCNQPTIPLLTATGANAGYMFGRIGNGFGKPIKIIEIACTNDRSIQPAAADDLAVKLGATTYKPTATAGALSPQAYLMMNTTATSPKCVGAPTSAGGDFRGVLYVKYQFSEDGFNRLAAANVIMKAQ